MHLRPNTHIMFSHNHAAHAGGAIYVQSVDLNDIPWCFYQFYEVNQTNYDLNIQILFENNTATFVGSTLYGSEDIALGSSSVFSTLNIDSKEMQFAILVV